MTKLKYTEIAGLETIIAGERAKFEELDNNISALEDRINEIQEELPKDGLKSVVGVQKNAELKTELNYLQTALETNKAERKAMLLDNEDAIANDVRNALMQHHEKVTKEYRAELKEQIAAKQAEINALHQEALSHNAAEYELLVQGLVGAQPYLTQNKNQLIQNTLHLYADAVPQIVQDIMQ